MVTAAMEDGSEAGGCPAGPGEGQRVLEPRESRA